MMTWHIVCRYGVNDRYTPTVTESDAVLLVPFNVPNHDDSIRTSLPKDLAQYRLTPSRVVIDLMCLAMAAYTADLRVSRRGTFDNWTRDLVLHIGVHQPERWAPLTATIARLLSFLTGDHWRVEIRHSDQPGFQEERQPNQAIPLETDTVSLFSGGLDSFAGVIDALERQPQVALVGHHALGQGATSVAQGEVYRTLTSIYETPRVPFLKFWANPPKGATRASENTTRGRSVLFLALGITVASCLSEGRLLIPENGFISLNVPLTLPRLGSFSTRTTHPHLIALLRDILSGLGIPVTLELPYKFTTKGEMLVSCRNQQVLQAGLDQTISCAHPGQNRFERGGNPHQHCGYCVPCLIRRAAIHMWGNDPTIYSVLDLEQPLSVIRGSDLRALKLALEHYRHHPPTPLNILEAGPLPGNAEERNGYLRVFQRGLAEIQSFLT